MIEVNKCPVCDSEIFAAHLSCEDHSVSREIFKIVKCTNCDLLITTPRPNANEMPKYYDSSAYTSHIGKAITLVDKFYLTARTFTLKWKINIAESRVKGSTKKHILDYGCGTGEFLRAAKLKGWDVTGMEPAVQARAFADPSIANNIKSSMHEVIAEKKTFDIISLWHVLEHIDDLHSILQQLKTLLSKSGTMLIAVPNHLSWDAKHYKEAWAGYDVPRHLWHFAPDTMDALLARHSLKITKIIPMRLDAFYICLLSEKYIAKSLTAGSICRAFLNACRSNFAARKSRKYSSLIYVVTK